MGAQDARFGVEVDATTDGFTKAITGAEQKAKSFSNASKGMSVSTKNLGFVAQQAGYQIGDLAVQVQGGTKFMTAFVQQGSQMLGIFGPMGAVMGAALAVFGSIGNAMMRTTEEAKDATDATSDLSSAIGAVGRYAFKTQSDLDQLRDKYGELTTEVRQFNIALIESLEAQTLVRLRENVQAIFSEQNIGEVIRGAFGKEIMAAAKRGIVAPLFEDEIDDIESAFNRFRTATSTEDQVAAFKTLAAVVRSVDPSGATDAFIQFRDKVLAARLTLFEYEKTLSDVAAGKVVLRQSASDANAELERSATLYNKLASFGEKWGKSMAQGQVNAQQAWMKQVKQDQREYERSMREMERANKQFGDAVADALMDADTSFSDFAKNMLRKWVHTQLSMAASQFLGSGILGGFGSAITGMFSYEGGGYTGRAPRAGGLDGKGGFLAMMHPNETVVDHAKGQGVAPVINQSFDFRNSALTSEVVRQAAAQGAQMGRNMVLSEIEQGGPMSRAVGRRS